MPDDFDSVVADRCSAVDDVPVPADLWSRVQFKVLDRLPVQFTEEEATMIDLETPSQTDEHRRGRSGSLVAGLLAAAAVVAIALVAIRNDDPVSPADQPSPTVTVPVTVSVVDFPNLTTTFVSPRNGFSIEHPDGGPRSHRPSSSGGSASRSTTDSMSWRPAWPPFSRARRRDPARSGPDSSRTGSLDR